ncbi:family 10 glycosylhydrolase [candidate division KSB1 bacterium]|nr:family 10 glycosylhydrolase [candidate division KSB1 bacterium]
MKKIFLVLFFLITTHAVAQPELRGVWIAWGGNFQSVPSKETIAAMMEDIAAHNLNTVYVDVWRYGYPYFRSKIFHDLTGKWTDPNLPAGRDVLADMIAEGHRCGLHVEAWFEYGFSACHDNNDDLYQVHPEWFAQHRDGSVLFNGDYRWKWLSHVNPEAQQFLIDLCQEVAANYDVDGIELDRIRYPELDCGYDPATVAAYQQNHNGAAPPAYSGDAEWMRWRAQKLTEFVAAFYDSIKAVNPDVFVSNAPIAYSYGYINFCQDWRSWINEGYLDFVSTQLYWPTNAVYVSELQRQISYITDLSKFYPGICSIANDYLVPTDEIIAMINTTRNYNLPGHVIWYYNTLADDLPQLKQTVYQSPVTVPDRPADWRQPAIIINEDDAAVVRSEGWTVYNGIPGFKDGNLYCRQDGDRWIEYYANIPEQGWYELYTFNIYHWNATQKAPFVIYSYKSVDTVLVDQNSLGTARWFKLGDYYFEAGGGQKIARLSNNNIGSSQLLFADAIMLIRSRRNLSIPTEVAQAGQAGPERIARLQNYPNPFNPVTTIDYHLARDGMVSLKLYDLVGREVRLLQDGFQQAGSYSVTFDAEGLCAGVYVCCLSTEYFSRTIRITLLK